jgi:hypothetical protein
MAEIRDMLSQSEIDAMEETVVDAVVLTDSSKSTELALRDPFKEWEIRLIQLREEEELRQVQARAEELARFVNGWEVKACELLLQSDALELTHHVEKLEAIGTWNRPARMQISFEIWWDFTRAQDPRPYVEWTLEELLRGQREVAEAQIPTRNYYAGLPT